MNSWLVSVRRKSSISNRTLSGSCEPRAATSSSATYSAAAKNFSAKTGATNSPSRSFRKPLSPCPSAGNPSAGRRSKPVRSRIVLLYSVRFSRGMVTDPGSRRALQSRLLMALSIHSTSACRSSTLGWAPWGGISPSRKTRSARSHTPRARSTEAWSSNTVKSTPAVCVPGPWQCTQYFPNSGRMRSERSASIRSSEAAACRPGAPDASRKTAVASLPPNVDRCTTRRLTHAAGIPGTAFASRRQS